MIPLKKNSKDFNEFMHEIILPILIIGGVICLLSLLFFVFPLLLIIPLVLGSSYLAYKVDYPKLLGTAQDKEKVLLGRLHKIPEFFNYLVGGVKMSYSTVELHQKLEAITKYLKIKFNQIPEHYECTRDDDQYENKPIPGTIIKENNAQT